LSKRETFQKPTPCCRVAAVASSRATTFHPYRRPTTTMASQEDSVSSQFFAAKRTSLPAFFLSDFHDITDDDLVLDQEDCAEDPPSDPDDSIGSVKGDY
ncbi:hypothetical protein COOONC_16211, partial [Cooperia oncophora]